jgi:ABC-type lipoprotein release transport system permease subunit
VFTGLLSTVFAIVLALPLAAGIGALVGTLSFYMPLPLMVSWTALLLWIVFIVVGTIGASLVPSLTASRLTIRQTLAYT